MPNFSADFTASIDAAVDGGIAFIGALFVGFVLLGLYRVISSSFLDRFLYSGFRELDRLLVRRVAPLAGVTLQSKRGRWSALIAAFLIPSAVAVIAPFPFAFSAIVLGIVIVLAVYRAWEADEKSRQAKEDMNETVATGNDLGNEVMFSLIFLIVFFALGFSRLSTVTPIYEGVPNVPIAQSAAFVWGEFLKAVPFVDASEVYGWSNVSGLKAKGSSGRTMTFVLRVFLDLILLAAILRTLAIVKRRAEGADLRDIRRLLASDEDDKVFAGIERLYDLSMRNRLNAQRELERIALTEVESAPRLNAPQFLLATAMHLGDLTRALGTQRFALIAVSACRSALEHYSRGDDPEGWAHTHINLGVALMILGMSSGDQKYLEEAILAYQTSLEAFGPNIILRQEVAIQTGLSGAWFLLSELTGDVQQARQAADAAQRALRVCAKEDMPLEWAAVQSNLGGALMGVGTHAGDAEQLQEAATAFRAALEVYTQDEMRSEWALVNSNLGSVLRKLGEMTGDTALLDEAIIASRAAVDVCDRDAEPSKWAGNQNSLANALMVRGMASMDTEVLKAAEAACRAILDVYTRDKMPSQWAMAQGNLGSALQLIGSANQDPSQLVEAETALRNATDVYTLEDRPYDWARMQNRRSVVLRVLGMMTKDTVPLTEALKASQATLKVQTRETVPLEWAETQENLGVAYQALFGISLQMSDLQKGIEALRLALEVKPRGGKNFDWITTQDRLALALTRYGMGNSEPEHGIVEKDPLLVKEALELWTAILEASKTQNQAHGVDGLEDQIASAKRWLKSQDLIAKLNGGEAVDWSELLGDKKETE